MHGHQRRLPVERAGDFRGIATAAGADHRSRTVTPNGSRTDVVTVARRRRAKSRPRSRIQAAEQTSGPPSSRARDQARISRPAHREAQVAVARGIGPTRIDRREAGAGARAFRQGERADGLLHQGPTTGRHRRRPRGRAGERQTRDRRRVSDLRVRRSSDSGPSEPANREVLGDLRRHDRSERRLGRGADRRGGSAASGQRLGLGLAQDPRRQVGRGQVDRFVVADERDP